MLTPGMEIATPTPYATPVPTVTVDPAATAVAEELAEAEDGRSWNEKVAGVPDNRSKKAKPTEAQDAEALEVETKQMAKDLAEVQKELQEKGPTAILTNPEFAKKVMKAMGGGKTGKDAKSPFAGVSDDEIKSLIKNRVVGTPIEQVLIDHPKILEFVVKFFKDDRAFLSLIKISTQEKKLKLYMAVVVFFILLSFLFNLIGSKNAPFWKRVLRKILVSVFILCCQFGALYYFFSEELAPTIQIAKTVFFS